MVYGFKEDEESIALAIEGEEMWVEVVGVETFTLLI
jgi:hypothetical protein